MIRSVGFFDSMPQPEPPQPTGPARRPHWQYPGENVMPVTLAADRLLVHRPHFAIYASGFSVYPYGFTFSVKVLRQIADPEQHFDPSAQDPFASARSFGSHPVQADQLLRLGVQFEDGRGAVAGAPMPPSSTRPKQPTMNLHHGVGGSGYWQQEFWVWGLPESGDVSIIYAWPAESVPEDRFTIDGKELRTAAARASFLWYEPGTQEGAHVER